MRNDTSNLHEKFKDITYFVHLFVDELASTKFSDKVKIILDRIKKKLRKIVSISKS